MVTSTISLNLYPDRSVLAVMQEGGISRRVIEAILLECAHFQTVD
jgi:hypothetical protein